MGESYTFDGGKIIHVLMGVIFVGGGKAKWGEVALAE